MTENTIRWFIIREKNTIYLQKKYGLYKTNEQAARLLDRRGQASVVFSMADQFIYRQ